LYLRRRHGAIGATAARRQNDGAAFFFGWRHGAVHGAVAPCEIRRRAKLLRTLPIPKRCRENAPADASTSKVSPADGRLATVRRGRETTITWVHERKGRGVI